MTPDSTLDERGKRCPLPVIALGKAAAAAEPGTVFELLSDDPAAIPDVAAWCRMKQATLLLSEPMTGGVGHRFVVQLGQPG